MSSLVKEINEDAFSGSVLESSLPVLVDFWAPWCGPCRNIMPVLDEVANELKGKVAFVKVNVDEDQELAVRYGVRGIPALFLFKDGKIIANKVGSVSKSDLLAFINDELDADK